MLNTILLRIAVLSPVLLVACASTAPVVPGMAAGVCEGEGYRLETSGPDGEQLMHQGKPAGTQCKLA